MIGQEIIFLNFDLNDNSPLTLCLRKNFPSGEVKNHKITHVLKGEDVKNNLKSDLPPLMIIMDFSQDQSQELKDLVEKIKTENLPTKVFLLVDPPSERPFKNWQLTEYEVQGFIPKPLDEDFLPLFLNDFLEFSISS
jgi:hypothetical protein